MRGKKRRRFEIGNHADLASPALAGYRAQTNVDQVHAHDCKP